MTTIWALEEQGYRTNYQSGVNMFFWIDQEYYRQHRQEILQWCKFYKCKVFDKNYGWVKVSNIRVETLFRLKWAGKCYND